MKSLLVALALLTSASSFALSTESSWSEILSSRNITVNTPQYQFSHGYFVNAEDTCVFDNTLYFAGEKTRTVCTNTVGSDDECTAYATVTPSVAVAGTRTGYTCVGNDNNQDCDIRTTSYTYPTTFSVDVSYESSNGENTHFLFSKMMTVPACY